MMINERMTSPKVKGIEDDTEVSIEQSYFQERLRQQAIKDKEKERTQFYTEQAIITLSIVGILFRNLFSK